MYIASIAKITTTKCWIWKYYRGVIMHLSSRTARSCISCLQGGGKRGGRSCDHPGLGLHRSDEAYQASDRVERSHGTLLRRNTLLVSYGVEWLLRACQAFKVDKQITGASGYQVTVAVGEGGREPEGDFGHRYNMEIRPYGRESGLYAGDDDLCDGVVWGR